MLVVCRTILRDIALNALGVRPEELCQDKGIFYIIYQIAYVVNIQTSSSERYVYLKEKGSVVLSYQFLVLSK
jgi:hypothetical protein